MKLSELQPRQSGIEVTVEVIDKGEVREFSKFGRAGRVCTAVVKDDSAQMNMTLWNEDIDKLKVGDRIKLTNGFVNEWQGEMQLTTGRAGKIEILEAQKDLSLEKPKTTKKPVKEELEEEPEEVENESYEEPEEPKEIEEDDEDQDFDEDLDVDEEYIE